MRCLYCGCSELKVIDSRPGDDGETIKRRRECVGCGRRFNTFEKIELKPVYVVKRNGNRQLFDADKVRRGILLACANRPVPIAKIDELVKDVEKSLYNGVDEEVKSETIGNLVMDRLIALDEVAYIRFASVYKQFTDSETFFAEMQKMFAHKQNLAKNAMASENKPVKGENSK